MAFKKEDLLKAIHYMATARAMSDLYEENFKLVSKYVHATSKGHEAIQIALGMQLLAEDYIYPYYRDDAMLIGMGIKPLDLILQLFAKKDDPFSGGRNYYCHPSLKQNNFPKIPFQSSATGMQAIPSTGAAMGVKYKETLKFETKNAPTVVVCSLGDACITEGEVSEAFFMASLKQLPILYLVQDNEWDISAHASEFRGNNDASSFIRGFPGIECIQIDGTDFHESFHTIKKILDAIRTERRPFLLHAKVPLLNHHTSGVRKEWYRDDLEVALLRDPFPKLMSLAKDANIDDITIKSIVDNAYLQIATDIKTASQSQDPSPSDLYTYDFAPTEILEEKGIRQPKDGSPKVMVDCALFGIKELMSKHKECLFYGQDVGRRLGGVFREAATLADTFGDARVFNTPIQEAFIIGSTAGLSAVGLRPIVEVQFADYIWPGLNQLFTEVSRSFYLSNGKWPVSMILRVPIGVYGSGGPFHSSSVETVVSNIRGIKIAYPSNGADLKGLLKAAYYDPNPVVIFEHKGLYWSKVPGTEYAKSIEPSEDYILPFGKGLLVQEALPEKILAGQSALIIAYGMGVHWGLNAANSLPGQISILDLRTLYPLDEALVAEEVKKHGKVLIITEEPLNNSFAQSLAGRIQEKLWDFLDAPVFLIGAKELPAIPLNSALEEEMMPNAAKVFEKLNYLLNY